MDLTQKPLFFSLSPYILLALPRISPSINTSMLYGGLINTKLFSVAEMMVKQRLALAFSSKYSEFPMCYFHKNCLSLSNIFLSPTLRPGAYWHIAACQIIMTQHYIRDLHIAFFQLANLHLSFPPSERTLCFSSHVRWTCFCSVASTQHPLGSIQSTRTVMPHWKPDCCVQTSRPMQGTSHSEVNTRLTVA